VDGRMRFAASVLDLVHHNRGVAKGFLGVNSHPLRDF